jgi:hypothetical protein
MNKEPSRATAKGAQYVSDRAPVLKIYQAPLLLKGPKLTSITAITASGIPSDA